MTMISFGDMARLFTGSRQTAQLKQRLNTLTQELSTGRPADMVAKLGPDQRRAADLERKLALTHDYAAAATDTAQWLSGMQLNLTAVNTARQRLTDNIMSLTVASPAAQLDTAAADSRVTFGQIVAAFNGRHGGAALFSGAATDQNALAPAADMLAAIEVAIVGAATVDDVKTAIDDWFDTPGGGFETTGYRGDTGAALTRAIDAGESLEVNVRADDTAVRDILKAAALGAMAGNGALGFDREARFQMLSDAGARLMSSAYGVVDMQARLGQAEARTDEVSARHTARRAAWSVMLNDLVSVDPFETAATLKEAESQMEVHYTLTARLSGLSLARYLR